MTSKAWSEIVSAVAQNPTLKYLVVPMERLVENHHGLREDFEPRPEDEPQLIFRHDAIEEFNPDFPWGRRPKVELFWRLGIQGPWDRWIDDSWDPPRRERSDEAELVGTAGWVLRLFSGEKHQEERGKPGMEKRGEARKEAIIATVFATNRRIVPVPGDPLGLAFYATPALEAVRAALGAGANAPPGVASDIIADAERALRMGPFSVVDKSGPPPNEDLHDYCSPAPYWWPDPEQPDGVPFIRRDGLRAPAAELFSAESGRYDRTRLQLTFDGTTSLALGWFLTGRADFAEHGARFVRTWFLDPATRMNPHLNYAQVRFGHSENRGNRQGIIEFKDVYYFLDAVRLLHHAGALTDAELSAFRGWLTEYRDWLVESEAGTAEARSHNNHGTYHELQMVAIQSFLGDRSALSRTYLRAMYRLMEQFDSEGNQPREISRPISQHYAYFNLQGWLHVLGLLRRGGYYDIDNAHQPYPRLAAAVAGLRKAAEAEWPHQQIIPFDETRLEPLVWAAGRLGLADGEAEVTPSTRTKTRFDPLTGIAPYWQLGLG